MSGSVLQHLRDWLWPAGQRGLPASRPPPSSALPEGLRLYAIGDVHGEAALLDDLSRRIDADLARRPAREARAIFVGDYIDRGPDSRGVIDRLASADFPLRFEALRGNHEDLMLRALGDVRAMPHWVRTGGIETLRSYGLNCGRGKAPPEKALYRLRQDFLDALPDSHLAFLEATRTSWSAGDYFFVHAGARPGIPLDAQDEEDLLWIRDECYESSFDFGKVLVHGHTPHKRPQSLPRRINVDTGAFKWGVLTAVVLEGDTRRFLSTRD